MKIKTKRIILTIISLLLLSIAGQQNAPNPTDLTENMTLPRMPDIGIISSVIIPLESYLSLYDSAQNSAGYIITTTSMNQGKAIQYDKNGALLWEYNYKGSNSPAIVVLSNGNTLLVVDNKYLTALNQNGKAIWNVTIPENLSVDIILPSSDGGIVCFGHYFKNAASYENFDGASIALKISASGQIGELHNFNIEKTPMMDIHSVPGQGNGYIWNLTGGGIVAPDSDEWHGIIRLNEDLTIAWKYQIKENYPRVTDISISESGKILLLSRDSVIELDENRQLISRIEIPDQRPINASYLTTGKKVIYFMNQEELDAWEGGRCRIYDGDTFIEEIELSYRVDNIYPLKNGSFTLSGRRIAPNQLSGQIGKSMLAYFSSSHPISPRNIVKIDNIVEQYSSEHYQIIGRRTYPKTTISLIPYISILHALTQKDGTVLIISR